MADTPTRRIRLALTLGADDLTELASALEQIARDIDTGHITEQTKRLGSGGVGSGFTLTLDVDPEQTGARYHAQLNEWIRSRHPAASS